MCEACALNCLQLQRCVYIHACIRKKVNGIRLNGKTTALKINHASTMFSPVFVLFCGKTDMMRRRREAFTVNSTQNHPGQVSPREHFNYYHQSGRRTTVPIILILYYMHTYYPDLILIKHLAGSLIHIIISIISNHLLWTEFHYFEKSWWLLFCTVPFK